MKTTFKQTMMDRFESFIDYISCDFEQDRFTDGILTHPTYNDIHNGCVYLAHKIKQSGNPPDLIVGLVRGGMLPAVILSNLLEIPCQAIHYSSQDGAGDDKNHCNDIQQLQGKNILLVDDICDTGKTLEEVYGELTRRKQFCRSAVLYYKEDMDGHIPEFAWQTIPSNAPWIIFPFEGTLDEAETD